MGLATKPFKSNGTTLGYKLPPATSFLTLGELKNFDLGGTDIASIDVTLLAGVAFEKIPSIPDNGDVTFTVFLVPGEATGTIVQLQLWSQSPVTLPWQVQLPDGSPPVPPLTTNTGTTINFNAFLSNFTTKGFETGGTPTADITITISGGVSMTLGS